MRNCGSDLHRHILRKTLNVCANRRDRNKFKGNEFVAFLRRSIRKWDRQCIYFGFVILKSSSNSPVLLYYYPSIFPYSRHYSWGIFPTVDWVSLFPVDRSPYPMLSAMVSQVLTSRDHDFSSGLWPDNRSAPDRSWMWDAPRVFSYETTRNWNLFFERLWCRCVSEPSQPVGIVTVRQAEQPKN